LIPLELFFFNILYHFFLLFPQFMPLLSIIIFPNHQSSIIVGDRGQVTGDSKEGDKVTGDSKEGDKVAENIISILIIFPNHQSSIPKRKKQIAR
jgi:hypothetical protein